MTIPAMAAATVERFGERPAVVDGDTRLTYAEVHDAARTFGAALVEAGIEPGDRVAIWAPNDAEWVVTLLGLLHAGAAVVPVNTNSRVPKRRTFWLAAVPPRAHHGHRLPWHRLRGRVPRHGRRPAGAGDDRRRPWTRVRRHRAVGRFPREGD